MQNLLIQFILPVFLGGLPWAIIIAAEIQYRTFSILALIAIWFVLLLISTYLNVYTDVIAIRKTQQRLALQDRLQLILTGAIKRFGESAVFSATTYRPSLCLMPLFIQKRFSFLRTVLKPIACLDAERLSECETICIGQGPVGIAFEDGFKNADWNLYDLRKKRGRQKVCLVVGIDVIQEGVKVRGVVEMSSAKRNSFAIFNDKEFLRFIVGEIRQLGIFLK